MTGDGSVSQRVKQPWDWLDEWEARLSPPPPGWRRGWVAFSMGVIGASTSEWMAQKSLNEAGAFAKPKAIAESEARKLFATAKKNVRPCPIQLRADRVLNPEEFVAGARSRNIPIHHDPACDTFQDGAARFDHQVGIERAIGILQRFGRVSVGAFGFTPAGEPSNRVDFAVLLDAGGVAMGEMMNVVTDQRTWRGKRDLADAFEQHGAWFLFVGAPWETQIARGTRSLFTLAGPRRVHDPPDWNQVDTPTIAPTPRIAHLTDPEELADDGETLLAERWLRG